MMNQPPVPRSLFDKLWDAHDVCGETTGYHLLYVDRLLLEDSSNEVLERLEGSGLSVRRPELVFSTVDHYAPSTPKSHGRGDDNQIEHIQKFSSRCRQSGFHHFGLGDPRQGITHVIGPELGLTLPGMMLLCCDSHTSTHGALGALAFGIGNTEAVHVLATQTIWQRRPRQMRINLSNSMGAGVTAKDLALYVIGAIGAEGASGHAVEYAGEAIGMLSIEERMTLCNMAVEAGARIALVAPDETTFRYIQGRPLAPRGQDLKLALAYWSTLRSDHGCVFDRDIEFDAEMIAPMVSWGTSPEQSLPITETVPDPAQEPDMSKRLAAKRALEYMQLTPGTPLSEIQIDRVFIGSCTNSRISDLRAAAQVVRGNRARVPAVVVPGSWAVRREAEAEGIDRAFEDAGFEWREPSCSMCVAMNGDTVRSGERCASTSNRNFIGRQGPGARTHLMSPQMAAAAALTGKLTDVRLQLRSQQ